MKKNLNTNISSMLVELHTIFITESKVYQLTWLIQWSTFQYANANTVLNLPMCNIQLSPTLWLPFLLTIFNYNQNLHSSDCVVSLSIDFTHLSMFLLRPTTLYIKLDLVPSVFRHCWQWISCVCCAYNILIICAYNTFLFVFKIAIFSPRCGNKAIKESIKCSVQKKS